MDERPGKGHVGGLFMSGRDIMPSLPSIGHEITKRGQRDNVWHLAECPLVRSPFALYHLSRLPFVTGHGGTIPRDEQWMMKEIPRMKGKDYFIPSANRLAVMCYVVRLCVR